MRELELRSAILAAAAGASAVACLPVSAQDGLDEVVVTATRREQSLQDVPISIVALTGDGLALRGLDSLEDVGQSIPNIVITGAGGGTNQTNFRIRGIPNVGTYIDGVWQISTNGLLTQDLVELDRIEVLRGPQGTTFGRDSTGGAIRIWTKRPAEELGGTVSATVGSYDRRDVKVALDLPLTDSLRTKWTAASLNRDGYIQSLTLNQKMGSIDQAVFRGDVVWTPTDNLDFRFNYQDSDNTFSEPRVQDAIFRTFDQQLQVIGVPELYGLAGREPYDAVNQTSGYPGGRVGKWETRTNGTLPNHIATEQLSIEMNWQLTDSMKLQVVAADVKMDSDAYRDWDGSQYNLISDLAREKLDVTSEEIQLTGGNDRIRWVAGAYFWDQTLRTRSSRFLIEEFRLGQISPDPVFASPVCTAQVPTGWLSCEAVYNNALSPGQSTDTIGINGQDGWAAFGEVTIALGETLDLTVGLRQHDQSGYGQTLTFLPGVTAPKPATVNLLHTGGDPFAGTALPAGRSPFEFDKLTSRLSLAKEFSDDIMGYVSYSEGFNSGGVSAVTLDVRRLIPFDPETLKNFEIGFRSDLANGRVRFNATLFHTDWEDIQALGPVRNPLTGQTLAQTLRTNVGDAVAEGVEFELTLLATERFLINLNAGLLDTKYTDLPAGLMSGPVAWTTETEFALAPETTYSLGLQHTADLGSGGSLVSRLDYSYQSQYWRQDPFLRINSYAAVPPGYEESGDVGMLNARLSYEPANAEYEISVFGTNLTNEYAINSGFFQGVWGFDFATVSRPREVGGMITFRF